jgi:hypothetical protein
MRVLSAFLPDEKTLTCTYAGIADFIRERYGKP